LPDEACTVGEKQRGPGPPAPTPPAAVGVEEEEEEEAAALVAGLAAAADASISAKRPAGSKCAPGLSNVMSSTDKPLLSTERWRPLL
jgi:hypothetical protein